MKRITLLVFMISTLLLNAQTVSIKWGPELKEPGGTVTTKILGEDKGFFYTLRSKSSLFSSSLFIEKYDKKSLTLKYSKEVLYPKNAPHANGKEVDYEGMMMLKGKIVLLTSFTTSAKMKYTYACNINMTNGMPDKEVIVLDEYDLSKVKTSFKLFNPTPDAGIVHFYISTDTSKIMIFRYDNEFKKEHIKFTLKVVDDQLKIVWSKSFELPYPNREITLRRILTDNSGNVFMLFKVKDPEVKSKKEPNYKFQLVSYYVKEDLTKTNEIELGGSFITDIRMEMGNDKNLVCAGFYSDQNKSTSANKAKWDQADGAFYMSLNAATREVLKTNKSEFDRQVFLDVFAKKKKADKEDDLPNFDIDDFIFRDDGGMTMVSEQYIEYTVTYTDANGRSHTSTHYKYNHILITNFNADGSVAWNKVIRKLQHSVNDGGYYSSYASFVEGHKLFFIFNDDKDNIGLKDETDRETMANPKKSVGMLATVDSKGKIERDLLFKNKEIESILRPKLFLQINAHEGIIFSELKRDYRYGIVSFK